MKSKVLLAGILSLLAFSIMVFSGNMIGGETGSKGCPQHAGKVEGKGCDPEQCQKMKAHQETMQKMVNEMGEHLAYMGSIQNEAQWMEEMEKHLGMMQAYFEESANCPMEGMMHEMMHHGEKGEAESGT